MSHAFNADMLLNDVMMGLGNVQRVQSRILPLQQQPTPHSV